MFPVLFATKIGILSLTFKTVLDDKTLMTNTEAAQLANLIVNANSFAFLTGAGISTASGLPDFRSADGLWKKYDPRYAGSLTGWRKDPALVWSYYVDRIKLANPQPNAAHTAVARLSKLDGFMGVITQNVDGLHEQAQGEKDVTPIHGTLRQAHCLKCNLKIPMDEALSIRRENNNTWPPCPRCKTRPMKPAVVMFEEALDAHDVGHAEFVAGEVDLLIVLGTSLEVWPVSQLPEIAIENGRKVAIITAGDTPYDHRGIAFRSRQKLDTFLPVVAELVSQRGEGLRSH